MQLDPAFVFKYNRNTKLKVHRGGDKMEEIVERYRALMEPIIEEHNCEIYNLEAKFIGRTIHLIVRVDKRDHRICLEECADLNEAISQAIDDAKANWFGQPFVLEVTSPGAERPIESEQDWQRAIGEYIRLSYFGHEDGEPYHEGVLVDIDDEYYYIMFNQMGRTKRLKIPKKSVLSARFAVKI